jgi:hypothetical protein
MTHAGAQYAAVLTTRIRTRSRAAGSVITLAFAMSACAAPSASEAGSPSPSAVQSSAVQSSAETPSPSDVVGFTPHEPLEPGTYTSYVFDTPLTFTVPAGWKVFEDEIGQFGLALLDNDGPCLCVWRDVQVAAPGCAPVPQPGIGMSAAEVTESLSSRPGLLPSVPAPVSIGGLSGWVVDVRMDPAWTETCGGQASVATLVGTGISSGVFWGAGADSAQRVYVLDLGGADSGNIAINVEVCCGVDFETRMAAVTPVIESFEFPTSP